jgi:isopenicillin N synthase-like dioxygenase
VLTPGHHGILAHTDSTTLSIINQDAAAAGGVFLQVLHDGAWRDLAARPGAHNDGGGALLVNLGDMATAISADAYKSVPHRVVASTGDGERLSLSYSAFPRDDTVVSCEGSRYCLFTVPEFRA